MDKTTRPFILIRDTLRIGDRVQHRGAKTWGTILEISPRRDGTAELRIAYDPAEKYFKGESWWATYHVGAVELTPRDDRYSVFWSYGWRTTWKKCLPACTGTDCHCTACGATGEQLCENGYCYKHNHQDGAEGLECDGECLIGIGRASAYHTP